MEMVKKNIVEKKFSCMTRVHIVIFLLCVIHALVSVNVLPFSRSCGHTSLCGLHLCASSKRFTSPYYVHTYFTYNTKRKLGKKSFCGPVCFLNNSESFCLPIVWNVYPSLLNFPVQISVDFTSII